MASSGDSEGTQPMVGEELRRRLAFPDAALLAECDVHLHRVSGPGGQHRNKVASAVRLVHRASGLTATATKRRSQHENRAQALKRLREAIALAARAALPEVLVWPDAVEVRNRQLRVGERNPALPEVLALVLDALQSAKGRLSDAAACLGVTGSSLTRLLAAHRPAWREANRIRQEFGLGPLRE